MTTARIICRADGALRNATLRTGMRPSDLVAIEREWGPYRTKLRLELSKCGVERPGWPQSLHWDWSLKATDLQLLESSGHAVEYQEATQGVMLTRTASYVSRLDEGKPLVYVDYLESAPWNWHVPAIQHAGEYRGIGAALFFSAIMQSEAEGFRGRVGLHALPQAESFYAAGCRMINLGPDRSKENLIYFELSQAEAQQHLREAGVK